MADFDNTKSGSNDKTEPNTNSGNSAKDTKQSSGDNKNRNNFNSNRNSDGNKKPGNGFKPTMGSKPFNTSNNKNPQSSAESLEKGAKTAANSAVALGKAAGKAASGNLVGAAVEVVKDEGMRKIIIAIAAIIIVLPIMLLSLVPSVIFLPIQEAYEHTIAPLVDMVKGWWDSAWGTVTGAWDTVTGWLGFTEWDGGDYKDYLFDEDSLRIVADQDTTGQEKDFNEAPDKAMKTMDKMVEIARQAYDYRHEEVLKYIDKDFNSRKRGYSCSVVKVLNDPLASGKVSTDSEVVKLMSLYTVQTNDEVQDKNFDNFLTWLGDKSSSGLFKEPDKDNYPDWKVPPEKWKGDMLPQKQMDEALAAMEAGTYDRNDYSEYFTSALAEILYIDPTVNERTETFTYEDDDGIEHSETIVYLDYTIKARSVDEICNEVVKFDEAVPASGDYVGSYNPAYRAGYFKELVGNGAGEGVSLEYFGVSKSSGAYYGGNGSGSAIVAMALSQIGEKEIGTTNNVKYNTWFYGHSVSGGNFPWCAVFVSWCADQCGIGPDVIPKTAWCGDYERCGTYFSMLQFRSGEYTPMPGDLVIRGGNKHVGIIEKYEDGKLYTIEGNSGPGISDVNNDGGCVGEHMYTDVPGSWYSSGYFCRPNYPVTSGLGSYPTSQKFALSESQIRNLAGLAVGEAGTDKDGLSAVISHMRNLYNWKYNGKGKTDPNDFYNKVYRRFSEGGWYANKSFNAAPTVDAIALVRSILVEGNATMPSYVVEFDMFPLDCAKSGDWNTRYRSSDGQCGYVAGETPVSQNPSRGLHSSGTFYYIMWSDPIDANIFWYTNSAKQQYDASPW